MSALGVLFVRPDLVLNPKALAWGLNHAAMVRSWSWKNAKMNHTWVHWNERRFNGHFKNFCLKANTDALNVDTCLPLITWDFTLAWTMDKGLQNISHIPWTIVSSFLRLKLMDSPPPEKEESPPDVWMYWRLAWSPLVPDMDVWMKRIELKDQKYDLRMIKKKKTLWARSWLLELTADPDRIVITVPRPYALPDKLELGRPWYLRDLKLEARMKEDEIPLTFTGQLEEIHLKAMSYIDLPLKKDLVRDTLLWTTFQVKIPNVKEAAKEMGPDGANSLPAPLNAMNGPISIEGSIVPTKKYQVVRVKALTSVDLTSPKQALQFDLSTLVDLDTEKFSPGAIVLGLAFRKVKLQLPKLAKTSLPPQFFPDGRIKQKASDMKGAPKQAEEERPLIFKLEAQGKDALHIVSNLIDEPLRLNMALQIARAQIQSGYIDILPLRTTVFKRPITIPDFRVTFDYPLEPVLNGHIVFKLPEYKITASIKGPVSKPRYAFVSDPPLPQSDIYAVLLFGRPMSELAPEDSTAASRSQQIISQGLLSLSVLYFLAGSPVEYVGYDPTSGGATAQIGLGSKSSVRVGGGQGGLTSTNVRRSLGKGWYLDTSVQNTSSAQSTQESKTYGVMLERIISY